MRSGRDRYNSNGESVHWHGLWVLGTVGWLAGRDRDIKRTQRHFVCRGDWAFAGVACEHPSAVRGDGHVRQHMCSRDFTRSESGMISRTTALTVSLSSSAVAPAMSPNGTAVVGPALSEIEACSIVRLLPSAKPNWAIPDPRSRSRYRHRHHTCGESERDGARAYRA